MRTNQIAGIPHEQKQQQINGTNKNQKNNFGLYTHKCVFNEGNAKYLHINELHKRRPTDKRTHILWKFFSETLPFHILPSFLTPFALKIGKHQVPSTTYNRHFGMKEFYLIFFFFRIVSVLRTMSTHSRIFNVFFFLIYTFFLILACVYVCVLAILTRM